MDVDPELDVTLSNGCRVVTYQIAALDRDLGTWTVAEPLVPRRVILGNAEALDARRRLDVRIAARLDAGWVPVHATSAAAGPLPADLARDLSYLIETVTTAVDTLRTADPTGQLWAAWVIFRREAHHIRVPAVLTRRARAQRDKRLGELAEQAGDRAAAIQYYQAALATHPRAGVRRRLARLCAEAMGRPTVERDRTPRPRPHPRWPVRRR